MSASTIPETGTRTGTGTGAAGDTRRDWLLYVGMGAVGLAAAASSYAALQDLAVRTGWWSWLSWLLPLTVDAYAMTAVRLWLGRATRNRQARAWAKANAIGGIALSVAGNAVDHAASAGVITVSWPLIVAVSAIPPVTLGLLVHMGHLSTLPPTDSPVDDSPRGPVADTATAPQQQPVELAEAAALPALPGHPPAVDGAAKPRQPRRAATGSKQRRALPKGMSDDELIGAARQRIAEGGDASATWLMKTYGIGTGRAARIRDAAYRAPRLAAAPEPTADRAAPIPAGPAPVVSLTKSSNGTGTDDHELPEMEEEAS
ncbi:hypothetical protein GCM10010218_24570 [Streptomyces mashuensis]|uniref:DUF2637 domain-containing protein n=1 Tax=Streptomyces mashuensis TaxID=33904 RepID=A0A919B1K2_9ACTN|nr:DUF2637 domain-containing protein [Streptomyces mashuensis]GHF42503.1 hypothetical protein GCM10010218_24570 [Streptomyces mashuensis]